MTKGLLFWVIMLIWLVFGIFFYWPKRTDPTKPGSAPWPLGGHIILWVLLALLGWQVFGAAIR